MDARIVCGRQVYTVWGNALIEHIDIDKSDGSPFRLHAHKKKFCVNGNGSDKAMV